MFRKNSNFERELRDELPFKNALAEAAKLAAEASREIAHRIMPARRGQNISVVVKGDEVAVVNFDHGGHLDEWGSINNPAYAPLRKGVRAAGLKFREE